MVLRSALLAAMPLLLAAPAQRASMQLLSLSVPMSPGERIDAFEIGTISVDIVAICRLPAMWTLSAGANSSVAGVLTGQAGYGAATFGPEDVDGLADLFLVRMHASPAGVPNFSGTATLVTAGPLPRERIVRITGEELRSAPAEQCPPPR